MDIKTFKIFDKRSWIGPVTILNNSDLIETNLGSFKNKTEDNLRIGYSYILRVENNEILETGMSCVDLIILVDTGTNYKLLSIKRLKDPFKDMWANPGGNIDESEKPIDAAIRELEEETNIKLNKEDLKLTGIFDKPFRDPRNKNCISYAFTAILNHYPKVIVGDDAGDYQWIDVDYNGNVNVEMAFDHSEIIKNSIIKIRK
jgi:8-oxo-dGTP diphosphatase